MLHKRMIDIQDFMHISSSRSSAMEDTHFATKDVERVAVVELPRSPGSGSIPISPKSLSRLMRHGKLTTSGITQNRAGNSIAVLFETKYVQIDLIRPASLSDKRPLS